MCYISYKLVVLVYLETVEHMDGSKRWRSICTLGMSGITLFIIFLLSLSLCPEFYWSEISETIDINTTYTNNNNSNIDVNYLNSFKFNSVNSNKNIIEKLCILTLSHI